jgi:exosome complex exonuclease RRP6
MMKYAREDTHYLLYIYDTFRRKLIAMGMLKSPKNSVQFLRAALDQSRDVCLRMYVKPELKDCRYFTMIANHATGLSRTQCSVLKFLLKWRDYISRLEDESSPFVCANADIVHIARAVPVLVFVFRAVDSVCTAQGLL